MLILAIDTTTRSGSIALVKDGALLAEMSGDQSKTHAERLSADMVRLLAEHHLDVSAIDVFGVAAGPGSFTGLRIGIATVQGLAFAMNRLVVPVSTLDALACVAAGASSGGDRLVGAFMDAQRSEVFAALYRIVSEPAASLPQLIPIDGPVSEPPAVVLERWARLTAPRDGEGGASSAATTGDEEIWIAGDAVFRYRELLDEHLGSRYRLVDPLPPLAPTIARIAAGEAAAGRAVAPHAIRPVYVRRPDAELARDRHKVPRHAS